jgi:hypothetical protein
VSSTITREAPALDASGALAFEYYNPPAVGAVRLGDAFEMTRREDERQLAGAGTQLAPRIDRDLFLARRGRAGDQHRASMRERLKLRAERRSLEALEIELGVTGHDDAARRRTERNETARVVFSLRENQIGRGERLAQQWANVPISGDALGDAAVDDRNPRAARCDSMK